MRENRDNREMRITGKRVVILGSDKSCNFKTSLEHSNMKILRLLSSMLFRSYV